MVPHSPPKTQHEHDSERRPGKRLSSDVFLREYEPGTAKLLAFPALSLTGRGAVLA